MYNNGRSVMNKSFVFVILLLCFCLLCSCGSGKLDSEREQQIKQDYAAFVNQKVGSISAEDVIIEEYYGLYGEETDIMFITTTKSGYYLAVTIKEEIAGYEFTFPSSQPLYVYHNSDFIPIRDAYECGILDENDVKKIHRLYTKGEK